MKCYLSALRPVIMLYETTFTRNVYLTPKHLYNPLKPTFGTEMVKLHTNCELEMGKVTLSGKKR